MPRPFNSEPHGQKPQNMIVLLGSKVELNNGRTDSRLTFKHVSLQENHLVIYLGVLYLLCSLNKINKKGKKNHRKRISSRGGTKVKGQFGSFVLGIFLIRGADRLSNLCRLCNQAVRRLRKVMAGPRCPLLLAP